MRLDRITPFPYTFTDLYRVCLRINGLLPSFVLAGHQVTPRLVYLREYAPEMTLATHSDDSFEINICLIGHATIRLGAEASVTPGTVVYQEPHTTCQWRNGEQGCLTIFLRMSVEPLLSLPQPERWPVWPWVLDDLSLIIDESRHNLFGWAERAGWRLSTVLSRVLARSSDLGKAEKPPSYAHDYLPDVVETFLARHLAFPITIEQVASHAQVSSRTLMREYRRRTGLTVMQRLQQLRMQAALYCLQETSLPLADIAVQSGIHDTNYFSRVFRRHHGVPPMQYRAAWRKHALPGEQAKESGTENTDKT